MADVLSGVLVAIIPAILLASLVLWMASIARWTHGAPLVPYHPRRPVPWGLIDLVLILAVPLVLAGAAILFAFVSHAPPKAVFSNTPPEVRQPVETASESTKAAAGREAAEILAACAAELVLLGLAVLLLIARARAGWRDLGIDLQQAAGDLQRGLVGFVMLAPPMFLVQFILTHWIPYRHPVITMLLEHPDVRLLAAAGLATVIVAPIVEEYFFRVMLQGWLENIHRFFPTNRRGLLLGIRPGQAPDRPLAAEPVEPAETAETDAPYDGPPRPSSSTEPDFPTASEGHRTGFQTKPSPATAEPSRIGNGTPDDSGPVDSSDQLAVWPIVASSALFAVMHLNHGPAPIPLFLLALGLGYLYQRTHRVLPSIVVHALVNASSMLVLWNEILHRPQ